MLGSAPARASARGMEQEENNNKKIQSDSGRPGIGKGSKDEEGEYATYTPAADYNGQDSFTFKSYDGSLYSDDAATTTITITEVNDAPYAGSIENIEVPENSNIIIELENYIGDYEDHVNTLNITFLPEASDSESSIVGTTFYGGSITDLGGH